MLQGLVRRGTVKLGLVGRGEAGSGKVRLGSAWHGFMMFIKGR